MRRAGFAALLLCACGGRPGAPAAPEMSWAPEAAPGDFIVATVAGTPILGSQIAAHARSTGLPKKAALDDLVRQELLARQARQRGYDRQAEVDLVRREEMVRLFVARDFGARTADPSVIPDSDLRPVYEKGIEFFKHGKQARVWNVCTTPEQARAIYEAARAQPPANKTAFQELARAHGGLAQEVLVEENSIAFAEKWRRALFAAVAQAGDLMPPAHLPDLPFPCSDHVAFAEQYWPRRNESFEQARKELAQKVWEDWRKQSFARWAGQMAREHQIEIHPEHLPHE